MIKQVIVIRKDLNMRKGKMCAQASHASMKVFFDRMSKISDTKYECSMTPEMIEWKDGIFTKITVSVDSENELVSLYNSIPDSIPKSIIEDCGLTEFHGVPTKTCIAIGPADADEIDLYTKHLKLL